MVLVRSRSGPSRSKSLPWGRQSAIGAAPARSRRPLYIAGGLLVFGVSTYVSWFYVTLLKVEAAEASDENRIRPGTDVSDRYNECAQTFDDEVGWTESISLLNHLRKKLVKDATGHVLEVSVGTGRNASYYNLKNCKSITFLDQSSPMVRIARDKWQQLYPKKPANLSVAFRVQDTMAAMPVPKGGFDTIIQTMGVCSTPDPVGTLVHLGSLLNPSQGRLLLLEHGKGSYSWINWILDKDASRHADKFGCWFNRDIGKILTDSGLYIEKCERPYWWNFGTVWYIQARAKGWETSKNDAS